MQRRHNAPAPRRSPSAGVSRYLVEYRGKLLMVVQILPMGGDRRRLGRTRALPRVRLLAFEASQFGVCSSSREARSLRLRRAYGRAAPTRLEGESFA